MPQDRTGEDEVPPEARAQEQGWGRRLSAWAARRWRRRPSPQLESEKLERAYQHFIDSVKETIEDFATMEINSVLVNNISADRPLADVDLLRQIGADLFAWFKDHATDGKVQRPLTAASLTALDQLSQTLGFPVAAPQDGDIKTVLADSTACLADEGDPRRERLSEEANQRSEYRRYLRYLQKFLVLCEGENWQEDGAGKFRCRERQQLRKLWELVGTTFVYAQTVVGLDGDVVSRINEQLFHPAQGLSREHIDTLIRFHNHNTEASAHGRNALISIIVDTLRAALRR